MQVSSRRIEEPPDLFGRTGIGDEPDCAGAVVDQEGQGRHDMVDLDGGDVPGSMVLVLACPRWG